MNTDRNNLREFISFNNIVARVGVGISNVRENKRNIILLLAYIIYGIYLWVSKYTQYQSTISNNEWINDVDELLNKGIFIILWLFGVLLIIILYSHPILAWKYQRDLIRAGLVNHMAESPTFLLRKYKRKAGNYIVYEFKFRTCGIPLDVWEDRQLLIQNALNIIISSIKRGKKENEIVITAVDGCFAYPERLEWKKEYLREQEPIIRLGENIGEFVEWNMGLIPHLLIGGSTGSGKSVLMKCIIMQAIQKGYAIYLADFKGGIDYTHKWRKKCNFILQQDILISELENMIQILRTRLETIEMLDCRNIDEYNNKVDNVKMQRIIMACDEVAELLDKTGLTKDEKEKISKIESYIATIARQGRAVGIHLILATQRPDANVISGQIKCNIDYRICGRADNVLSVIILDNGDASDKIPKGERGFFLNHEGVVFKGYVFDEEKEL